MVYSDYPIFRGEQQLPIFLLNMGLHLCQDHVVRPEGHSSPQILFCTRGSGTLVISGNRLNVPAGSAIFLPAALPHEYYANEDVWDIHWVIPGGSAAEEVLRQFGLEQPGVFELSDTRTLEHIFRKMHDAIRADSFFGNFRASGYLYDFLIEFYRLISSGSSSRAPSPCAHESARPDKQPLRRAAGNGRPVQLRRGIEAAPLPSFPEYPGSAADGVHREAPYPGGKVASYLD